MYKEHKKQDLAARVAWLYYVAGKTQLEIAKILGISRQIAQRLLSVAREQGLVNVNIVHPISECLELAQILADKYQLETVRVVPSIGADEQGIRDMISQEGAEVMSQFIDQETPQIIGIGSGKTLRDIIDVLPQRQRPQHISVSLIGAIARDGSATRYDVPLKLAEKIACKYFIIPAPLYAEIPEDKQTWCQHKAYQIVKDKALQSDVVFIGIGDVGLGCPLNTEQFLTDEQAIHLKQLGAVAELLGHFLNENGQPIESEFEALTTSIRLKPNSAMNVIGFAAGAHKYPSIKAVLKGRWLKGLVTDEQTALRLSQEP
ncbi:transcriptional regulator [Orbus hercynius]|uniref:Transcriptional regulator n=1 Tax=Orbus hercynius TaxID=593135 RepID=A0A495RKA5_9GAMM|nr:sugar-binding transcriptional regulator [Orbus hercynius]RKS87730.1 transcriptional regulator [Orbus hercynius]